MDSAENTPTTVLGERGGGWYLGVGWPEVGEHGGAGRKINSSNSYPCGLAYMAGDGKHSLEGGAPPREDDRNRWNVHWNLSIRKDREKVTLVQSKQLLEQIRLWMPSVFEKNDQVEVDPKGSREAEEIDGEEKEKGEEGESGVLKSNTPPLDDDEGDADMERYKFHHLAAVLSVDSTAANIHRLYEEELEEAEALETFGAKTKKNSRAVSLLSASSTSAASMLRKKVMEERVAKARVIMAQERADRDVAEEKQARAKLAKLASEFSYVDETEPRAPSISARAPLKKYVLPETALDRLISGFTKTA